MPQALRPREKMVSYGAQNLTEIELVAILLGTGTVDKNVLLLSEALLKKYSLKQLSRVSPGELQKFAGVGLSKAARVIAALELGNRAFAPSAFSKLIINTTEDIVAQLRDIADRKQEHLVVLYLNARRELLQKEIVGIGTLNAMRITPKEIFGPAVASPCATIVVAHNHPSNDPTPSEDDIYFTKVLQQAGEIMGIPLFDHVIVARASYYSFRDNRKY